VDTTKTITHLSLCSGYSGIGLGLKQLLPGLREIAHVEIEAFAVANLVAKMEEGWLPEAPIYTNVKTFPYERFRGCVDILSGGFPCQPFSAAGARKGVEDPRHLYPYISRGIRECRPRIVFLENVEGIISSKTADGESVLKYVLSDLEGMGYRATAGIFSAEEVGAPHRRKRVFILGYSKQSGLEGHDEYSSSEHRENEGDVIGSRSGCGTTEELGNTKHDGCSTSTKPGKVSGSQEEGRMQELEGRGNELADTNNSGGYEDRQPSELRTERSEQSFLDGGPTNEREGGKELPNTESEGLEGNVQDNNSEGWEEPNGQPTASSRFPARPSEPQYEWEEPRTKPKLGGTTDGTNSRVDRLRLLGNGVVPATAAKAFATLIRRIYVEEGSIPR